MAPPKSPLSSQRTPPDFPRLPQIPFELLGDRGREDFARLSGLVGPDVADPVEQDNQGVTNGVF